VFFFCSLSAVFARLGLKQSSTAIYFAWKPLEDDAFSSNQFEGKSFWREMN
jgi:hypothetical protein